MKRVRTAGAVALALSLALAGTPASAQFGALGRFIPGNGGNGAAAVDPDAFLAETIETTKLVMVSAAILAAAAETDQNRDALRARIATIEGASSIGEVNAQRDQFAVDARAATATMGDAAAFQARYDAMSQDQQQLMLTAAFNFTLGMMRNAVLAQQAPTLLSSIQSNPMLLMKLGSLRTAGELLTMQVRATGSMIEPMRILMSRGGVEVPAEARSSDARTVEI